VTGALQYQWSPPTGLSSVSGNLVQATPPFTQLYTVTGSDLWGCTGTDSILVSVNPLPVLTVSPEEASVCKGFPISLTVSGANSYLWSPPEFLSGNTGNLIIAMPLHTITYTVTGTDQNLCNNSAQITVEVYNLPELLMDDTAYVCQGEAFQLNATPIDFCKYTWQDGKNGPHYTLIKPGVYWVEAKVGDCVQSDTIVALACTELWVPNAFTPTQDDVNDYFKAKASTELKSFDIYIYNRWGAIIFESHDIYQGWDGRYEGKDCPNDVYVWTIQYEGLHQSGIKTRKGSVSLIR
jgi:gliding motility-associated-like protein